MADPQDPYSALNPEGSGAATGETVPTPTTFQVQEDPEYLKALKRQTTSYDVGSNTLTRYQGQPGTVQGAFAASQQMQPTAAATGDRPWTMDAGYRSMTPQQQQEFDSLMSQMESKNMESWTSTGKPYQAPTGCSTDQYTAWSNDMNSKYGWMQPTSYQRDTATGALCAYQSAAGQYDYLQPGQYAKTVDSAGKETYFYKDPTGKQPGVLRGDTPPEGSYDASMSDLYNVAYEDTDPKEYWDKFSSTYKYWQMPGLGNLPQEVQQEISPYFAQIDDLQSKIYDLQNLRPEERAQKESESGQSLTAYLSNLQDVQKQMSESLSGYSGIDIPQFDPVTGEKVTSEMQEYQKQVQARQEVQSMMANPYETGITENQMSTSMAMDILASIFGYNSGQELIRAPMAPPAPRGNMYAY